MFWQIFFPHTLNYQPQQPQPWWAKPHKAPAYCIQSLLNFKELWLLNKIKVLIHVLKH